MSDGEFDDWFNDCDAAGVELENQAAKHDERDREMRTKRTDTNKSDVSCTGHLIIKYMTPEGKGLLKVASGVLARKLSNDEYVLLTAAHNFDIYKDDLPLTIEEGAFFLQRNGKKEYAASFKFGEDDVFKLDSYKAIEKPIGVETQIGLKGNDIAAVKIRLSHKKSAIPPIP